MVARRVKLMQSRIYHTSWRGRVLRDTLLGRGRADADACAYSDFVSDDAGGRFRKQQPSTITGAQPVIQYPRQPVSSPWASDPVGTEPPLGFPIDQMEPTGE